MKSLLTMLAIVIIHHSLHAQTNIFPSSGNVGIGTTSPGVKLSVAYSNSSALISNLADGVSFQNASTASGALNALSFINPGGFASAAIAVSQTQTGNNGDNLILLTKANAGNWNANQLVLNPNGNVGIGTTTPDQKLAVNGAIHAKEVKVDLGVPAPDYVFEPDYKLTRLNEIKAYIDKNHHLPEIPSADQMAKEGVNLSEMNMKFLKKIEELTLYAIEKDRQVTDQQQQLKEQAERITRLEKALLKN